MFCSATQSSALKCTFTRMKDTHKPVTLSSNSCFITCSHTFLAQHIQTNTHTYTGHTHRPNHLELKVLQRSRDGSVIATTQNDLQQRACTLGTFRHLTIHFRCLLRVSLSKVMVSSSALVVRHNPTSGTHII